MAIKTSVVGTDLGESGRRAMQLAVRTAEATHATLWLVHASEMGLEHSWRDLPIGARSAAHALRQRLKGRFESALQELENERRECESAGLTCQTSCEEGAPWETILRTAVSVNADLIAVGDATGSVGLPERLLGSTAERVVRQAPCSVLVSCGRLRDDYKNARIAVGVDFSAHGARYEVDQCARCHARRHRVSPDHEHGRISTSSPSTCAKPMMPVSGVRSSCETFASRLDLNRAISSAWSRAGSSTPFPNR